MPAPLYPRTLGVTYLAGWLACNSRLLNQLVDDYRCPDLLLGLSWVAGVLASRLAEQDELSIEALINQLVHEAATTDMRKEPA